MEFPQVEVDARIHVRCHAVDLGDELLVAQLPEVLVAFHMAKVSDPCCSSGDNDEVGPFSASPSPRHMTDAHKPTLEVLGRVK